VLDSKADVEVVRDAPVPIDHLGTEASDHFEAVKSGLAAVGVPFSIEDKLVRGLDYYNRTVFEYVPGGYEAAQSAVGGGGRYDGLFEMLGGKPNPAVGLSMGIDRILQAGGEGPDTPSLDVFVVVVHESLRTDATVLVSTLRQAGLRADMPDEHRSVTAQFKEANRRGSMGAVVVGDEWSDGEVTVRDLVSGTQQVVGTKEIARWVDTL
jgi:histidyl-tRNA synthetase